MNEEKNRMNKSKENHTDMYVYVHTLTNTQSHINTDTHAHLHIIHYLYQIVPLTLCLKVFKVFAF